MEVALIDSITYGKRKPWTGSQTKCPGWHIFQIRGRPLCMYVCIYRYIFMYPHNTLAHTHTWPYKYFYCMHVFVVVSSFRNFRTIKVDGEQTGTLSGCTLATAVAAAARSFVQSIGSRVACFVWRLPESTRNVFTACVTYFPNNNNRR